MNFRPLVATLFCLCVSPASADAGDVCMNHELQLRSHVRYLQMNECSIYDMSEVNAYTYYKGDSCGMMRALISLWRSQSKLVQKLNDEQAQMMNTASREVRTDFYMQISYDMMMLRMKIHEGLKSLFGLDNILIIKTSPDLRDVHTLPLTGYSFALEKDWTSGRWPFDKSGAATFSAAMSESADGSVRICLGQNCLIYNNQGTLVGDQPVAGQPDTCFIQETANLR